MDPVEQHLRNLTRRQFFGKASQGLAAGMGVSALASILSPQNALAGSASAAGGSLGSPHLAPKAKRVIYLHQMGAPSQLDLFDYKPNLKEHYDKELPASIRGDQRITGMTSGQARLPVAPSIFKFNRYENNTDEGLYVSELYPHTGSCAKELCVVKSMHTEAINHEPGITFFQTGHQQPGRPSIGAWLSYGLGNANDNLPAFVVMISQGSGNMQTLSARMWGSGFLPSEHQGVKFRAGDDPVLFLSDPRGIRRDDRRAMLDAVNTINELEHDRTQDPEVMARIAQGEMAYRMQMSVPELTDFSDESQETLDLYGPDVKKPGSYASHCLLARRLAERDVRFIQLYHRGWDAHGNLPREIRAQCAATDQPQAALIKDLKRRGLLDETLVVWGGEFGRTVYSQGALSATNYGRDHHPRCFTIWMAGGGVKPGISYGQTDDFGYNLVENGQGVHVHDLHATMMQLLGIDHERLTYKFQGRRYRLTDIAGIIKHDLIA